MIVSSGMRVTPQRFSVPTGSVSVSFTALTVTDIAVNFGFTFAAAPRVHAQIASTAAVTAGWQARAVAATATGFTLRLWAPPGAAAQTWAGVPVTWTAVPA